MAVITNGTAVLGLGDIGPLAAKPVMEGKGVLFKKFAGIDVFDIEINEKDPDKLVDIIAALEPTFGGINLEDIKAPDCFYVERKLRERMKIPVFHDDQHGTAIIVGAAMLNGLKVVGKDIERGQAGRPRAPAPRRWPAWTCWSKLGLPRENIWVTDLAGVVYEGPHRADGRGQGASSRRRPRARTLAEVIDGADIFLGLSAGGVLKPDDGRDDGAAAADPRAGQPDAGDPAGGGARRCAATRSSPPAAPTIRTRSTTSCASRTSSAARSTAARPRSRVEMEIAAVHAIAELAQAEQSDVVAAAYAGAARCRFGPEYLIPKPFDPRLMMKIAPAVAKAARRVRRGAAPDRRTWTPTARSCRASSTPPAR